MKMDVLIATDDKYVDKYLVMLTSLLENNQRHNICIHLIKSETLSETGIYQIENLILTYGQKLKTWNLTGQHIKKLDGIDFSKWGQASIYRLLALSILEGMDRFLWLDGDIIISGDLADFYNQSFDGNLIVACEDIALTGLYRKRLFTHISGLKDAIYYNSGVVLFNLIEICESGIIDTMWEWTRLHVKDLQYPDQDIINVVFNGRIKAEKPNIYNCQTGAIHWSLEKEILANAKIIHFVGTKPWDKEYRKKLSCAVTGNVWWKYAIKNDMWKNKHLVWQIYQILNIYPWNIIYKIYWNIKNAKY